MKKSVLPWLFCIGFLVPAKAQITLSSAIFPAVGDTLNYAVDVQPQNIVMTPPGGAQQWDFSSLRGSISRREIYQDARSGADFNVFPSATLRYATGVREVEAYLQVTSQQVNLLGFSGDDPVGLGLDLISRYNPPITQTRAPLNFFDIHQVSSGLLLAFSSNILPDSILNRLPIRPDSLRIRVAINRLDVVDAWGTLAIPGGNFEVLREKRTEYRETRLDAKVPPLGWLDVTDVAIQALGLPTLGVDTTVSFHFWSNQSKETVAVVFTDDTQLRAASIQFKNLDRTSGRPRLQQLFADLRVFPNPARDVLQLRADELPSGEYMVQLFNALGQEVYRSNPLEVSGRLELSLPVGQLAKGLYWCRLVNGQGEGVQRGFVRE